ncbi:MAG: SRPBCC family protein [Actinomycetota bacterium]
MDLENSFEVDAGREVAWRVLNDVERIAPCLPGAQLEEIDGDEFKGSVKVKVGPVTAQYKGKAVFVEQNEDQGKVVIKGEGRDSRGAGNANALITATLHEISAEKTRVDVHTDLAITGKVAQFGRGVMADVSGKLMGQFADNLQELLANEPAEPEADSTDEAAEAPAQDSGPRKIDSPEAEAVDLLDAAGAPVLQRALPVVGVLAALLILRRLIRGRRG